MTAHHRWMLRLQREQLEFLERQIAELDIRIQEHTSAYQQAVDLCLTIPGIEKVAAANLIAEIGSTWINSPPPSIWQVGPAFAPETTKVPAND